MAKSRSDTQRCELNSSIKSDWQAIPLKQATNNNACKGISGSGVIGRDIITFNFPESVINLIISNYGGCCLIR